MKTRRVRFRLDRVVVAPGALELLDCVGIEPLELLARHTRGGWDDICAADKRENEISLQNGYRLFSAYNVGGGGRVWVITKGAK